MEGQRHLVRSIIPVPWHYPLDPDGGLPETLVPQSRMPVGQSVALGLRVWCCGEVGERRPDAQPLCEDAVVWVEAFGADGHAALSAAAPALELVLDHLSFQLQIRLEPRDTEVLNVEPPILPPEERSFLRLVEGYKPWKRRLSVDHGSTHTLIVPVIVPEYAEIERHVQRAIDWYLLSLSAQSDAERFMLAWIAFEVLDDLLPGGVEAPFTARCGHVIAACPTCSASTSRQVMGPSRKARLTELGIGEEHALRIWRTRQMMHGAESFGPDRLGDLAELTQVLRAAVMALLRATLAIPDDVPPFVGYGVPATNGVALGGTRSVSDDDLPPGFLG